MQTLTEEKNRLKSILKLLNRAFGQYKPQIVILTGLGFVSGLLEGVGVNALIPLFSFITGQENVLPDAISRGIKQFFLALHLQYSALSLLAFIALLFVLKAAVLHTINYVVAIITADYERRAREDLFRKTLFATWPYLLREKIGYLEKVLTTDIANSASLMAFISGAILTVTGLVVYVGVALNISMTITLLTFGFGLIGFLLFKPLIYRIRRLSQQYNETIKAATHYINENMLGIKAIKAAALEEQVAHKSRKFFDALRERRVRIYILRSISGVVLEPVSLVFICAVFGFYLFTAGTQFNIASFAVVVYLIKRIFDYIQKTIKSISDMNELAPYMKSMVEYQNAAIAHQEQNPPMAAPELKKEIVLQNVSFAYDDRRGQVFKNLNFHIQKNQMVGLVGPSGAGKTTLFDLLLGLLQPSSGKILIDDTALEEVNPQQWRKQIGYVSQNHFLLNDTIKNNIKFYEENITDQDIEAASKMAFIHDFIQQLPQGYQTIVGERGVSLSEGQRQRVALARVLAHKPQILLLDEATSALDNESEVMIQKALEKLKGQITILIIAHRLSTVMNTNELLVLDRERIIEQGSPAALLKNKNSYFYKAYHIKTI